MGQARSGSFHEMVQQASGGATLNPNRRHWNDVWATKSHLEVSWFQSEPAPSLEAIDDIGVGEADEIIDVGCGESHLAEGLLERGVGKVHLLDVSSVAIEALRSRLAGCETAKRVIYHPIGVLELDSRLSVSLWHDRAVLHFIREPEARARYAAVAAAAVRPGGHLVVGGFAEDGPPRCSDLEVERAGEDELVELFGADFDLKSFTRESHETPWGALQSFQWCVFQRHWETS